MSKAGRAAYYTLSGLLLALTVALIVEGAFDLELILAWLIGINLITLLFYRIDKLNGEWADLSPANEAKYVRIPEPSLLLLALFGGSPAAALAIVLLPHKIRNGWFLLGFLMILAAHALLVFLWSDRLPLP